MSEIVRLTDEEFFERFRPELSDDGGWPRMRDIPDDAEVIEQARRENRLWTQLDCDGTPVLASGYHYVNRLYYVITEVPWDRDYEVHDEGDPHQEALDLLDRLRATLEPLRPEFEANQARYGDILDDMDEIEKLQQKRTTANA